MHKGEARCPSLGSVVLAPSQSVTPARVAAFTVLRRVAEQGAYADRALHTEARDLVGRDRAFARQLTFGTIQRLGSLDHHIATLARPVDKLDPAVAAALRLGLYQLLFLDGVPDHAAVTESVELAKSEGESRGGHRLVNAVLRRAARERPELPGDATPADAAIHHSQPRWIVDLWWEQFGAEEAREMLASTNRPAELALRVNTLVTDPESLASALPVPTRRATELPDEGLVVEGPFDAHSHPLFAAGAYQPQSRASMRVAPALDPQPGERILDLCAAPGGKTTHMAARMGDRGTIVSVERHPGRAKALARTVDAAARELGAGDDGRRRAAQLPPRVRPGAHRSAVLRARHAPGPPGPALAHDARARRGPLRPAVPHRRARARGAAPRRDARLQHVHPHDARERGRPGRRGRVAGVPGAHPAAPRRHGGIHDRSAEALMRQDGEMDLGPTCPGCGEPWLRPTNLPGRYRCVNCLHRFELVSVCPQCGEHSTIVRMSNTAIMRCVHCDSSMLQPI